MYIVEKYYPGFGGWHREESFPDSDQAKAFVAQSIESDDAAGYCFDYRIREES